MSVNEREKKDLAKGKKSGQRGKNVTWVRTPPLAPSVSSSPIFVSMLSSYTEISRVNINTP
jgi:hypothetical protein